MNDALITVEGISKKFCRDFRKSLWYGVNDVGREILGKPHSQHDQLRKDEFWAIRNVSFELKRGECLGLVGRNGAGKSTLLRMLNGLIKPDEGRIAIRGNIGALISLGAGFNPVLTGRENIYVNAAILGLSKRETDARIHGIIDFSELEEFIDMPVQSYSAGMQMRLGFSVASALNPDVLLIDEVLAVGDSRFRAKCFKRIGEVLSNAAVIFVSHNEAQINRICDAALYLRSGNVRYAGEPSEALRLYRDDNAEALPSARLVMHSGISNIKLRSGSCQASWGGAVDLELDFEITKEIVPGVLYVHFSQEDEYRATAEFVFTKDSLRQPLGPGLHTVRLTIAPLYLAHGRYHLSFSMFEATGKSTAFQAFDLAVLDMDGPVGHGPSHLMPMKAEIS